MGKVYSVQINYSGTLVKRLRDIISLAKDAREEMQAINNTSLKGGSRGGSGGGGSVRSSAGGSINTDLAKTWDVQKKRLVSQLPYFYNGRYAFAAIAESVASLGYAAGKANPAILKLVGTLGAGVALLASPFLGSRYANKFAQSNLYSQATTDAIRNAASVRMAQNMMGLGFDEAYQNAKTVAVNSGVSRFATLELMNMLSGLKINGQAISAQNASWIANVVAKISQYSGRDMKLVAMNMQQILTTWQGIDIKELMKSVPVIAQRLTQMHQSSGSNAKDVYSYIRQNPNALIEAFKFFDQSYQLDAAARAKGLIDDAKSAFEMAQKEAYTPLYQAYGATESTLYKNKEAILSNIWAGESPEKLIQSLSLWNNITLTWFDLTETLKKLFIKFPSTWVGKALSWVVEGGARTLEVGGGAIIDAITLGNTNQSGPAWANFWEWLENRDGDLAPGVYSRRLKKDWFHGNRWEYTPQEANYDGADRFIVPGIDANGNVVGIAPTFGGVGTDLTTGEEEKIQNLTKGSRALIINFNKELVVMTNNIQGTAEEITDKIYEVVADSVSRSMTLALGNATGIN